MAENIIVLYPAAGAGHLVSMVEFGKLILSHHPSLSISIIISAAAADDAASTASYIAAVSSAAPSITFRRLPTVSLPQDHSSSIPKTFKPYNLTRLNNPNLRQILFDISQISTPKALIVDFFCSAASEIAAEFKIPTFFFFTSGGYGLAVFLYLPTIHRKTGRSLKDLPPRTQLDVPGVPPFRASDMPREMLNPDVYLDFLSTGTQMAKSAGIIVHTFRLLEENAIKTIEEGLCVPGDRTPPVFCVGPIVTTSAVAAGDKKHDCLIWLDSQPERSVVFLCFGSMGRFSAAQLKETAAGLERSGVRFLWVVRNPPAGDETGRNLAGGEVSLESLLPGGFLDRTRDRGLVVREWAPQAAVLSHASVGGFVTHCGWNSILEAVSGGVPMVAWPLYAEQRLNKEILEAAMGIALPVTVAENGFVSADELAERVSELMNSEKGKALRERAEAMKEGAMKAMREGGSSIVELDKFIDSVKLG